MSRQAIEAAATAFGIAVRVEAPIAAHTTFRIGGAADLLARAATQDELITLASAASAHEAPYTVLGGGSNILVADAGIRGLVILNGARRSRTENLPDGGVMVVAESGVMLAGLARWTVRQGLAGLEWAVSVPGTVGGAVIGNAGAHGSSMAANLAWAKVWMPGVGATRMAGDDLMFAYRASDLRSQIAAMPGEAPVVLEAALQLAPDRPDAVAARAEAYLAHRKATQPIEPSAGSVFRNPPGSHAGRLLEVAGLKGRRIGGAQFSPKHANFIVNIGGATAADVMGLIQLARETVWSRSRIRLTPEILFVGAWDETPPSAAFPNGVTA
jgi:UDP-N-acetylmuramate dehydrogenase